MLFHLKSTQDVTERHCTYDVILRRFQVDHCCHGKAVIIKYNGVFPYYCLFRKSRIFCAVLYCHLWPVRFYPIFLH